MDFADFDSCFGKCGNSVLWFLVFNCQMAGVIVHTDKRKDPIRAAGSIDEFFEKPDGFSARFEESERFGLQTQMENCPGFLTHPRNKIRTSAHILENGVLLRG